MVVLRRQAALVVAVELDFHFRTIGEAVAVVFVHFVQQAGIPAEAPLIAFQVRNLGIARDLSDHPGLLRRQFTGLQALTGKQLRQLTGVAFQFGFGVDGIKAQAEAEVLIQAVSAAQVQVQRLQIGFTAVSARGVAVIEFGR